jgi:hypothetical protein
MDKADELRHQMMHYFHLDALDLTPSVKAKNKQLQCFPFTFTQIHALSSTQKRILGFCMALFSGVMYGINFMPAQYLMDNFPEKYISRIT